MSKVWSWVQRTIEPLRPRLLPRIVIIGAQKAGTSALHQMLLRHPRIAGAKEKELTFFGNDETYALGMRHYRSLLPVRPVRTSGWITLDATPNYMYRPPAAARIHKHLPQALIVAILRDPVKRARSDWNMFHDFKENLRRKHLYDPRSFEQAMTEELAAPTPFGYLARGRYAEQLERYFELFGREQVLVYTYPRFKAEPGVIVREVVERAGLDPTLVPGGLARIKANVRPRHGGEADHIEVRLRAYYAPYMAELEELMGRPMDLDEAG